MGICLEVQQEIGECWQPNYAIGEICISDVITDLERKMGYGTLPHFKVTKGTFSRKYLECPMCRNFSVGGDKKPTLLLMSA